MSGRGIRNMPQGDIWSTISAISNTYKEKNQQFVLKDPVLHLCSLPELLKVLILHVFYFNFQSWITLQFISTTLIRKKCISKYFNSLLNYPNENHKI